MINGLTAGASGMQSPANLENSALPVSSCYGASHRSSLPQASANHSMPFSPTNSHAQPFFRQPQTSPNVNSSFALNSSLMIGDYVTPGSLILPTQGIHIGSASQPSNKQGNQ